jgi:hypothetical protein
MTLEEDEDIDLNPALSASGHQARSEKQSPAKTKVQPALTRCAEIATVIPIIVLLLPVYALVQVGAAAVRIYRLLREQIQRRTLVPGVCSASQNLKVKQIADMIATTGIAAPKK